MASISNRYSVKTIQRNRYCDPAEEINILLLGQTGVGKSTFINGLVNYLCHDKLDEAVYHPLQSCISSSFSFTEAIGEDRNFK